MIKSKQGSFCCNVLIINLFIQPVRTVKSQPSLINGANKNYDEVKERLRLNLDS